MLDTRRSWIRLASDTAWGLGESVQRALLPSPQPLLTSGGAMLYAQSEYSPEHAMSPLGGYPWARVGLLAKAVDLAGLPVIAFGTDGRPDPDHWFVRLLERPDRGWSGVRWRRQLVVDLKATGNSYHRKICPPGSTRPIRLRRLHPATMTLVVDSVTEEPLHWMYRGRIQYALDEIMHIADVSWRDDVALQYIGESPIRSLKISITAAIDARRQAGKAAKRGRLEMLLSAPKGTSFGRKGVEDLKASWLDGVERGDGIYVATQGVVATPLSMIARDTEWALLDERTRDETLSVLGVPPVRAQLPSANYGAARQEMRQYWETNKGDTSLIDAEFSHVAGTKVKHSFESVEALQTAYTERLSRVEAWVRLGANPLEAARAEGFENPPLTADSRPATSGTDLVPPSTQQVDAPAARAYRALQHASLLVMASEQREWGDVAFSVAQCLEAVGVPRDVARVAAARAADAFESQMDVDRIECDTLPAFGTEHAGIIADEMEAFNAV